MTTAVILLIILLLVLFCIAIIQQGIILSTKKNINKDNGEISKERDATEAILKLSREVVDSEISDEEFLSKYVEYALKTIKGTGAVILKLGAAKKFYVCGVSGSLPSLKANITPQREKELMANPENHLDFLKNIKIPFNLDDVKNILGDKKYVLIHDSQPEWLPENFRKESPLILLSPIYMNSKITAVILIVSSEKSDIKKISDEAGSYLVRLNKIAAIGLKGIKAFRERREYEEQVQTAREEGMLQVSAGIIHNIGNAITVGKLSVHELKQNLPTNKEAPENLLLEEIVPNMKKKLEEGKLQEFMTKDKTGSQYIEIITELLEHISKSKANSSKVLDSLSKKLQHISEIIELQQNFVGELGTENMVALNNVINSSVKIFEETFNKHGVEINTEFSEVPNVLIDPSMMTQVFMNLIKNAVEAMDSENDPEKNYRLDISLFQETIDGNKFVITEIKDNGPGMDEKVKNKIFTFGFSTKSKEERTSRGYGLHSCINTVAKYGGNLEVESEKGKGTAFRIVLPRGKEEE